MQNGKFRIVKYFRNLFSVGVGLLHPLPPSPPHPHVGQNNQQLSREPLYRFFNGSYYSEVKLVDIAWNCGAILQIWDVLYPCCNYVTED